MGEALPPVECFRCGICCVKYQPPVVPEEIDKVAAGLGLSAKDFLAKYGQSTYIGNLIRRERGKCVFLGYEPDGKATCQIHAFRPEACRTWVASLSRRECQEGLAKIEAEGTLMLPEELHLKPEEIERLSSDASQD